MAREHIKAASTNLRRVVTDLKRDEKQLRADTADRKREIETRLKEIRNEQGQLRDMAVDSNNKTGQIDAMLLVGKLEDEYKHLTKELSELDSSTDKELQHIDQKAREFGGLADRLESRA